MDALIVSDLCALRPLALAHAEPLYALVDAERGRLRQFLPWVDGTRSAEHTGAFIRQSEAQRAVGLAFDYAVEHGGRVVGVAALTRIRKEHRSGEIGYWLASSAEGQGLMTACCRRILRFAFENRDLHRIVVNAALANQRSRAVALRLGMTHEATLRDAEWVNDRFVDHAVYRLLRPEWDAQRR